MAADNIYAIATATAKKAGYSNFEEGSDGEKKREEIVLALKRRGMKKAQKYIRSGDLKMKDVRPGRDLEKKPYTSDELLRDNNPTVRRKEQRRISLEDYRANREAAKYQARGERKKSVMEQRKPATPTPKDPNAPKRAPSGFAKPTLMSNELCAFLGEAPGTEMARTEVTKYLTTYIKQNNLQNQANKRIILPDDKLTALLNVTDTDEVTYFNLQKYMKVHFPKQSKSAGASSSA